jgi:non-ribosomal peptide synthetase component F
LWLDALRQAYSDRIEGASPRSTVSDKRPGGGLSSTSHDTSESTERGMAYWREQLLDAAPLPIPKPTRYASVEPTGGWGATRIAFSFDRAVADRARACAQAAKATLPMLMHAALNIALARALAVLDQPVGVLASNRDAHTEGDMGLFVETLIVRTRMREDATLSDVVAAVRDATICAYEHMATPLANVLGAMRDERGDGHALLTALFNYVRAEAEPVPWGAVRATPFNDIRRRMLFELELDIAEDPQGNLRGALSFAHERVDAGFARCLAKGYTDAVEQLADRPAARVIGAVLATSTVSSVHREQQ